MAVNYGARPEGESNRDRLERQWAEARRRAAARRVRQLQRESARRWRPEAEASPPGIILPSVVSPVPPSPVPEPVPPSPVPEPAPVRRAIHRRYKENS